LDVPLASCCAGPTMPTPPSTVRRLWSATKTAASGQRCSCCCSCLRPLSYSGFLGCSILFSAVYAFRCNKDLTGPC
jgi:hypothetical protein